MNKTSPFISIITVCYNSEMTIERTLLSVLNQQFEDYEYLIVDGHSTDNTIDIVRKYELLFNGRLKWKSEPDKGIYDAFNKGCKWAQGKYVWIVNSDDYIEAGALSAIYYKYKANHQNHLPILVGKMKYVTEDQEVISTTTTISKASIQRAYEHDYMGAPHPATVVPKEVYESVGYYDDRFKISGDIDWFNRVYSAGVEYEPIDEILTNFVYGGASTNGRFRDASSDRYLMFTKKYNNLFVVLFHYLRWWIVAVSLKLKNKNNK